ncbi:prephenate dehydrogenase [Methylomarinovum caldicuralii]|uniref:prephenate dehydrogenase n=1 Tax=Methylomarinovum caldicuralii TaxID=438856 RepID=A0AAU9C1V2_9GAMM|nr:prephenate dehydrogenase/arogenate dehydrogenase family protein [Methylomarinovum caldicuralii]BCX81568.1 prephenate dehydrogenase [Methylomarinovum caldicuralii]
MIERLCIIGIGLIGGSVALAARAQGLCREIVAADREEEALRQAEKRGIIDRGYRDIGKAAEEADAVVIATPVGRMAAVFEALKPVWSPRAFYTDVGSTKASVVQAVESVFGRVPENFVPAHPISGRELSGVAAALPDLFAGKKVILTPLPHTDVHVLERVRAFWQGLGAEVHDMSVAHHDHVLAATSHLPHVIAYCLTHLLGRKDEKDEIFQYAAGGFRDFSRIAGSCPVMWADICLANRDEILKLLRQFEGELQRFDELLSRGDRQAIHDYFAEARAARQRFLDRHS